MKSSWPEFLSEARFFDPRMPTKPRRSAHNASKEPGLPACTGGPKQNRESFLIIYVYVCMYVCMHTYIYMYVCMYVYMYVCIYIYIYIYTYRYPTIYIYISTLIYLCVRVCVYMCVCVCSRTRRRRPHDPRQAGRPVKHLVVPPPGRLMLKSAPCASKCRLFVRTQPGFRV